MAMVVKNNMSAINTLNTLNANSTALSKSLAKVSSGMKINGAADDASGYAISERMRVQIRGLDQANANTQNGSSMMKTAEGAVSSTVDILKTLKEKVISAANDDKTDADRAAIQKELDQSIDQINDNANITYNGKYLVDGSHNSSVIQTTTTMTNQMLNTGTKASTAFTQMKDRNGNSLNIQSLDTVTVSFVHQGVTYTTSFRAGAAVNTAGKVTGAATHSMSSLLKLANDEFKAKNSVGGPFKDQDLFSSDIKTGSVIGKDAAQDTVKTASGENAMTIKSAMSGLTGQISGFTISVSNTKGQIQKSINAVLDNFDESIRAQNKSEDNQITLQVGTKANQSIRVGLTDMRAEALGLASSTGKTLQIGTQAQANAAINVLDNAVQKALDQQTTIGAIQSRLEYTSSNLTTSSQNVQASESTIRDADMAKEMTNYTKNNVLLQAAQSMLAQANQSSSSVLSLLQ
ncbi:flagellin [Selenomonas sp. KH1T6]|uniref:flagellin N-terminal helical domain-containing protein n=1 Tax=Selenomonas sp. KH1T6 TaxID=3158784 RepID=UPI0008A7A56F|nr:flagellin [Selenomonas ruminantium]